MRHYYEHHIDIKKNKLFPFIFKYSDHILSAPCNWHQNIELLFVTEGYGRMQYDAEDIPLSPDDLFLINAGAIHRPYSECGISFYYLIIDESFCNENGIDTGSICFEKRVRDPEAKHAYFRIVELMKQYYEKEANVTVAKIRNAVLSLLVHLWEKHSCQTLVNNEGCLTSEYVKRVLDYINENFQTRIDLERLAELCGITKFHLAREFKRYTGQTIVTYINVIRCKYAKRCIANGMSVTAAAYESGFESLSYFSRTFRKHTGFSPSSSKKG